MKSLKHKRLLAGFMAMVFAIGAIIPANLPVHASSTTELVDTKANSEEEKAEPRLYDADTMQGLNATEIAVANDIVIAAGYGFDIENNFDGITYNDSAVKVSYYADKGSFDGNQAGNYETYYKVEPFSGHETYLICRTITVREPETATQSSASDNSAEESGSEDGESDGDVPDDLSVGEIEELTVEMPMMFMAVSEPLMMASAPATGTNDGPDKMKVSNAGYAKYCGHSMGIKYVSESGDYKNHLVYCLDMNKNTTNGDVSSSSTKSNVKPTITYCLVNGARTLNGTCHNKDYSSGSASQDYFITGASIHILNGEVGLSYYNNGSNTYKLISKMVEDAKKHADEYSDNGCTISITYDISPKKTDWKDMGDGLYRSTDKFVRTKSGTVKDIKYSISGAPSGLTVGEIKTDSSQIDDEADLKKYDICVAQTDASSASSNFYLYCNEEAMKKIVDNKSTIKIVAKAYSDEKGGRKWTPSVISQQKITFLEDFTPVSAQATVKVTSNFNEGSFSLYKSDKFTHNAVPGARYYLYEDKDCTDLLCKLSKTDDKGLSSSGKVILTQDKYYLKEVLEPDGYQRDNEVYEIPLSYFTLYDKDGKVIQQGKRKDVEEVPETIGVFVNKTDVGSGVVLKKAGFAVFNDPACTVRTKLEGQNGSAGEVPVFYYDADLDMAASQKFVKEQDKYYVKEVDVPDGYKDEAKIYTIAPPYGQFEKIDAVNTPIRCDLNCIKEDKETKNPQGDAKLDGALYGLYAAEDIKYPDGRDIVTYTGADNITSKSGNEFKSTGAKATKDALLATVRTDDKYAVHDNTEHTHGHIIYNSVNYLTGKKFRYEKGDWARVIQPITNRLCEEYGLSTIDIEMEGLDKQKRYQDWNEFRDGKFIWRDMIRRDVDACIMQSDTFEEFLDMLKEKGYEIKQNKYLAIKPQGMSHFCRCIYEVGDIIHNFNGSDYRVMERYTDKNMLLMDVNSGNFVVGIGVCQYARYPAGVNEYTPEIAEVGVEWDHGVYLPNMPSAIDFAALRREYGEALMEGKGEYQVEIRETLSSVQSIEAESMEDALYEVEQRYRNEDVVLDDSNHVETEYIPVGKSR